MPKTDAHVEAFYKLLLTNDDGSGAAADTAYTFAGSGATRTGLLKSTTPGNLYASLHTASPGYAGLPSSSEISYTGYARVALSCAGATWAISTVNGRKQIANAAAVTWGKMTGGTGGTVRFWGLGSIPSGTGTALDLLYFGPIALEIAKAFAVIDTSADDIICPGHGYAVGDQVSFIDTLGSGLPTGITEGTWYYVINASGGADANKFRVEASIGGGAIAITAVGSGYVVKALEKPVALNDEPKVGIGEMVLLEA